MLRKNENFGTDIILTLSGGGKVGAVEYQMPQMMADELLKERKGQEKNMRPQDYLVKYVNEQCGLMYNCVRVTTI